MRKAAMIFLVLFVGAFLVGMATSNVVAKGGGGGGGGGCFYSCDCAGNPIYCCPVPGGVSCKRVLFGIECPQVYEC